MKEGDEMIVEGKEKEEAIADLSLIAAAQKVEHYEISGYGTARAMAEQLGKQDVVNLLTSTLDEEGKADELLTKIAQPLLSEVSQVEA